MVSVSYLFVPGTRPDRFEKALASGADRVIIDLEDAVDVAEKDSARANIVEAVASGLSSPVIVRVNGPDSPWFEDDLAALRSALDRRTAGLAGIALPKLESAATIDRVRETVGALDGLEIIGLIESAVGVNEAETLARSGVTRIGVGAIDLSVDLGSDVHSPVLDIVYAQIVIASRLAGIASPLGSPPVELRDAAGITETARRLKSMGVGGQLCIHPAQVEPVHTAFTPTSDEVAWAHRVLASAPGSSQVDGQMVDKPVRDRAERIISISTRRNA